MMEKVLLYTDGASRGNPGNAALAYLVVQGERIIREHGEHIGRMTNNEAEYRAIIEGLKAAAQLGADEVEVFSDSQLVVRQMNGQYAVRAQGLIPLHRKAQEAVSMFSSVRFASVPREHPYIRMADQLANEALDGKRSSVQVEEKNLPGVGLRPIGIVRSAYKVQADAPRQGRTEPVESIIEIYPDYEAGLESVSSSRHLFILSWFDRSSRDVLSVERPEWPKPRGVFATRSPNRPNPIGLSLVDLIGIEGRVLRVRGLDALDGTPVLDIKPYSAGIDSP
ncbi:tRNA (N6-threonylcarbamoyladenosine(37)-N6)-methyltransferase TrmO [Methanocalculus alkaliphilus]|uniref:tRNA (N6-threonylcarbamoyladenosine(37)-N6)-methyltransferase TrmO n=1 Tax=Methanocalculus alkaliphilus TaxID=768730 RepID=UPI00344BDAE0